MVPGNTALLSFQFFAANFINSFLSVSGNSVVMRAISSLINRLYLLGSFLIITPSQSNLTVRFLLTPILDASLNALTASFLISSIAYSCH